MTRHLQAWILVAALALLGATARTEAAMLSFSPTAGSVPAGDRISVDVRISGLLAGQAPSLGTFDLRVGFDPGILSLASVVFGSGLDLFGLELDIRGTTPAGPGAVDVFEVSFDEAADLDTLQPDAFTLFTLEFDALSAGTSALTLGINALGDSLANPLGADITNGSVSVTTPVPLPAAGWLLVCGLGGLASMRRRRAAHRHPQLAAAQSSL